MWAIMGGGGLHAPIPGGFMTGKTVIDGATIPLMLPEEPKRKPTISAYGWYMLIDRYMTVVL